MALNDVPQPGQSLATTQNPIRTNFGTIDTAFSVDHVPYQTAINQGKHNKITFPVQAAAPATAVAEMALFSLVSTLTGVPELSVRKESSGASYEFTSAGTASPGWARLPSGILLKWGSDVMAGAGLNTYTFPVGANIPAFATIYNILVVPAYNSVGDGNGFARLNSFGAPWTQFTVYGSQRTTTTAAAVGFAYLAIGI